MIIAISRGHEGFTQDSTVRHGVQIKYIIYNPK
jgi:hypothetical protein